MSETSPAPSAAPSVQPRLGISHLLLWIFGAAVVLAFMRGFSPAAQERSAMQFLHVAQQVTFSLLAGTHIAAVIVYARRSVMRDAPLLLQPGHWLLVIAGVGSLAMWLMFGAALGFKQLAGAGDSPASILFLPASVGSILMIVLNLLPLGRLPLSRSWRLYFVAAAFLAAATALMFAAMFLASLSIELGAVFFLPTYSYYGYLCIYPLDQLATMVLLSLAFLADRAGHVPRDWVHRVGVVTIILQSVASLAYFWGMMLIAQ